LPQKYPGDIPAKPVNYGVGHSLHPGGRRQTKRPRHLNECILTSGAWFYTIAGPTVLFPPLEMGTKVR
jgi:hypothetical protein